jgi:8-oxo-dGTP pyrophosphatase MutT (NUDIX family)
MKMEATELQQKMRLALQGNSIPSLNQSIKPQPAAVLVPFVKKDDEWHLLFTKRTNGVAKHQGEISFPGGAAEKDDQNLIETAIRETREEIGIPGSQITILGVLEPVPTVSNYCVLPVVSIVEWPQRLVLNQTEVEGILLVPVDWLKDKKNWYEDDFFYEPGKHKKVIHYRNFEGEHLWGITALLAQNAIRYL